MENNQDPWTEYWAQDDFWKDSLLWKINAELFLRRADKMFAFNRNQSVLNIGCGPGYLEPLLCPKGQTDTRAGYGRTVCRPV
jgi:hypothetical protein